LFPGGLISGLIMGWVTIRDSSERNVLHMEDQMVRDTIRATLGQV
jgi:hypothetical protein